MKRLLVLLAVVAITVSASAAYAQLVNGSFESGNLNGWTNTGRTGSWDFPGGGDAKDGLKSARQIKGSFNTAIADGQLFQDQALASGLYDLSMSGWVKRYVLDGSYAKHEDWGSVKVELLADGVVVNSVTYAATDAWNNFSLTGQANVSSKVTANFLWSTATNGQWKTFDVVLVDGVNLTATAVPEPCTMLALLGGLAGLVIKRRK